MRVPHDISRNGSYALSFIESFFRVTRTYNRRCEEGAFAGGTREPFLLRLKKENKCSGIIWRQYLNDYTPGTFANDGKRREMCLICSSPRLLTQFFFGPLAVRGRFPFNPSEAAWVMFHIPGVLLFSSFLDFTQTYFNMEPILIRKTLNLKF